MQVYRQRGQREVVYSRVKWTEVLGYGWTEEGEGDRMVRGVRVAGVGRKVVGVDCGG
jgi:hypothetical protein